MSERRDSPGGAELTYEQAREELVQVVQRLESGGVPLDESLALWERGEHLAAVCQERLDGARAKVDAARARVGPQEQPEATDQAGSSSS